MISQENNSKRKNENVTKDYRKGGTLKRNSLKKMVGVFLAAMMAVSLLMSVTVYAGSTITSTYKIDGAYATGSTAIYDTSTAKFASATTSHKANSTKTVSVIGYYYMGSNLLNTSIQSNSAYTDPYVTVSANCPSDSSPCGSAGTHAVYGSSTSWSGNTSAGITSMK